MAKAFSVASWNVKHFKGENSRVGDVVQFLKDQQPDIFALYEVTGSAVYSALSERFPQYTFQITEGKQSQEILVGIKNNLTAFITQKLEFKSGATYMRPGLLVSIHKNEKDYSLLFLHVASGTNPRGMGLRDDMITRAIKFCKKLDTAAGGKGKAHYLFLGDLNTMGLQYPYNHNISPEKELKRADARASRYYGMRRLTKTVDLTWSGGSGSTLPDSDLDHVYATKNLSFRQFSKNNGPKCEVDVRGWVDLNTPNQRNTWLRRYSDHSLIYFEVQVPE